MINYLKAEQSFVIFLAYRYSYSYPQLTVALNALDKDMEKAYGYKGKGEDTSRIEFSLERIANDA